MRNGILVLSLAAAVAVANPWAPKFLSEVGSDSMRGQWVEIMNDMGADIRGWQITTTQSRCTLLCRAMVLVVDSALLARGDSAHGTFRFSPQGDVIQVTGCGESVSFPSLPAGGYAAPAFPSRGSLSCWQSGWSVGRCCWYVDSSPTPGQENDDYGAISGSLLGVPQSHYFDFTATASGPAARVDAQVDYQYGRFYFGGLSPGKYRVTASAIINGDTWSGAAPDSIELGYAESRTGVPVYFGWAMLESLPPGDKGKRVKDGACLASLDSGVYALKGGRTSEFYRFDTRSGRWRALAPIPVTGRLGQKKSVGKGATMCAVQGRLYATKGCGTAEFWEFAPDAGQGAWVQRADVPTGSKRLGSGASSAALVFDSTAWVYLLRGAGTGELYRYSPQTDNWFQQAGPPLTPSGRAFRAGSAMASDGAHTLYVLKGRTNEFYGCDLTSGIWSSLSDLPLAGSSQHRRKAGAGAGLAHVAADSAHPAAHLYALKGGNTQESWRYDVVSRGWNQSEDLSRGLGKKVGAGGALAAAGRVPYALKGARTLEFYSHPPDSVRMPAESQAARPSVEGNAVAVDLAPVLIVAPNPASSFVNVRLGVNRNVATKSTVRLYDAAGRVVLEMPVVLDRAGQSRSQRVDISALPDGCYFVSVEPRGKGSVQKVVKTGEH